MTSMGNIYVWRVRYPLDYQGYVPNLYTAQPQHHYKTEGTPWYTHEIDSFCGDT